MLEFRFKVLDLLHQAQLALIQLVGVLLLALLALQVAFNFHALPSLLRNQATRPIVSLDPVKGVNHVEDLVVFSLLKIDDILLLDEWI